MDGSLQARLGQALEKAGAAARAGRWQEMESLVAAGLKLPPGRVEVLQLCGITASRAGATQAAVEWFHRALAVQPDNPEIHHNLGAHYLNRREYELAARHLRVAVALAPGNWEYLYRLGRAHWFRRDYPEMGRSFEAAYDAGADRSEVLVEMARAWMHLDQPTQAERCLRRARELAPDSVPVLRALGGMLFVEGRFDEARQLLERALELDPEDAGCHASLGEILNVLGDEPQAAAALERALTLRPGYPGALAALAVIRRPRSDDPLCRQMEHALEGKDLSREERERLLFALGSACDRSAQYERAFELFGQGNRLHREVVEYDAGAFEENVRRMMGEFDPALCERLRVESDEEPVPIFIVGMPRSGSTLVEQILSCHPQVGAAGEVTALEQAGGGLARRIWQDPGLMGRLSPEEVAGATADYRRRVAETAGGRPLVTDKMLSNHRFLGLAAAMFPRARVIHCLRDPRDACLSSWFHLFYRAAYTFDLEELGRTWVASHRLLQFWREVLPIPVIPVRYEELVREPEARIRALLEALELPWEKRCLEFHGSERIVHTASTGQVRRPIYTSSVGRWRNYEKHLGPLLAALEPVL